MFGIDPVEYDWGGPIGGGEGCYHNGDIAGFWAKGKHNAAAFAAALYEYGSNDSGEDYIGETQFIDPAKVKYRWRRYMPSCGGVWMEASPGARGATVFTEYDYEDVELDHTLVRNPDYVRLDYADWCER